MKTRAKKGMVVMELTEWEAQKILTIRRDQEAAIRLYNSVSPQGEKFAALVDRVRELGWPE